MPFSPGPRGINRHLQLLGQGAAGRDQHDTGGRPEKLQVILRDLAGVPEKDRPGPVDAAAEGEGLDQLLQLFPKRLLIAARLLVEDHQIDRQPMHPPENAGLESLTDEGDFPRLADGDQHNGQISRDAVRPQAGLALAVVSRRLAEARNRALGNSR